MRAAFDPKGYGDELAEVWQGARDCPGAISSERVRMRADRRRCGVDFSSQSAMRRWNRKCSASRQVRRLFTVGAPEGGCPRWGSQS
jgi:hypothetical protein